MTKQAQAKQVKGASKVKQTSGLKGAALEAARAANVALVTKGAEETKAKAAPEIKPDKGAGRANRKLFGAHYPLFPEAGATKDGATFQGLTVVSLGPQGATFQERTEITDRKRRHKGNGRKVCLVCGNPLGEKAEADRVTGHCAKVFPLWLTGPLTEYAKGKGWGKAVDSLKAKASDIESKS